MAFLIGGLSRSGTTLLWRLCALHPDIMITNEFRNFLNLGQPYKQYVCRLLRLWGRRAKRKQRLLMPGRRKSWQVLLENNTFVAHYLLTMYRYRQNPVNVSVIEKTLKHLFPEARIVGDKFPRYVFSLDTYIDVEKLSCIIIYRDGRDVISSFLKQVRTTWRDMTWIEEADTAKKIAARWVRAIEIMERHTEKIRVIRYEDLIHYPERELEALGKYLGVSPEGFQTKIAKKTSIGKYKRGLTSEELASVMEIAGPTLQKLNYL